MAKITPITEQFQHFLAEMKESFWGDLYGRTRQAWKQYFERELERRTSASEVCLRVQSRVRAVWPIWKGGEKTPFRPSATQRARTAPPCWPTCNGPQSTALSISRTGPGGGENTSSMLKICHYKKRGPTPSLLYLQL